MEIAARRWGLKVRHHGIGWGMRAIRARIRPYRLADWHKIVLQFTGARALEIGGPSSVFDAKGLLPLYSTLTSLDNVQFASSTPWQGSVPDGAPFGAGGATGYQWVREAIDLAGLGDYDALLASHVLEHCANPLQALTEWRRALRPGGLMVVVTPNPNGMFDHRRPITSLEHLRADRSVREDDTSHLAEVLQLDDRTLSDDPSMTRADMEPLWRDNLATRALHHHVFDASLLELALREADLHPVVIDHVWPYHTIAIAARDSLAVAADLRS